MPKKKKTAEQRNAELSAEYTYAPIAMLIADENSEDKRHWQAKNCDRLADYMETVPDKKHCQSTYAFMWNDHGYNTNTNKYERYACGTPACALGHAAYSNEFPGLQFGVRYESRDVADVAPIVNGEAVSWVAAGRLFFSRYAKNRIFSNTYHSKQRVIELLREAADLLRS